jgi:signal transduction histidine kinase/lipopolysaccharide biosynthesis regulator YciM
MQITQRTYRKTCRSLLTALGALIFLCSFAKDSTYLERLKKLSEQGKHMEVIHLSDSLKALKTYDGPQLMLLHWNSGLAYRYTNKPIKAIQEFRIVAAQSENSEQIAEAFFQLGDLYFEEGSLDQSLNFFTESLRHYQDLQDEKNVARVKYKAGVVHARKGNHESAIQMFNSALSSTKNDPLRTAFCHEELAAVYYNQTDFEKALDHFMAANQLYREYNFASSLVENLLKMAKIYELIDQPEMSISLYGEAAEESFKLRNFPRAALCYHLMSEQYTYLGDYRDAIKAQEKALEVHPEDRINDHAHHMIDLAILYGAVNRNTDALMLFHDAYSFSQKHKFIDLMERAARHQAEFHKKRGDFSEAYNQLSIADSLLRIDSHNKVASLRRELTSVKLHEDSYIRTNQDSRTIQEKSQLRSLWKMIIIVIVSFTLILILLYREFVQKRKLSKILEWKVYKRTRELRKANKELNTYIYKSSHDLRTPLTSIKSLLRLLNKEDHNPTTRKYLGLIEGCSEQMDEILVNLSRAVDYKKVDLKIERIDFSKIQFEIEEKELINAEGIHLEWDLNEESQFYSDFKLLKVILMRTIHNSIDYRLGTPKDFCKITVHTHRHGATIKIKDNGQGISDKVKDNVFDMFVKGTHKSKGAGLGLYLVKIACEKIRGRVSLETKENAGSMLIFELPNLEHD